jgi:hypothetical protein
MAVVILMDQWEHLNRKLRFRINPQLDLQLNLHIGLVHIDLPSRHVIAQIFIVCDLE